MCVKWALKLSECSSLQHFCITLNINKKIYYFYYKYILIQLSKFYKNCLITFQEYKPGTAPVTAAPAPSGDAAYLDQQITKQGDLVRTLKTAKAEKDKVDEAVKGLLDFKAKYKAATGQVSTTGFYIYGSQQTPGPE